MEKGRNRRIMTLPKDYGGIRNKTAFFAQFYLKFK